MIVTVHTLAQKRQFLAAARRDPLLHALLGRDLTLWADNPGAPVRLFLAGEAALSVSSNSAWLAGAPDDPEELASFLRFVGVENLYTAARDPATDFRLAGRERGYCLPPGRTLPQPPLPQGFVLDTDLGAGAAASLLFPYSAADRDGFYSRTCTAVNHGLARLWGLRDARGQLAATVGADALFAGQAYLSLLCTAPCYRRRGLGSWLVLAISNALSVRGWQCVFLSEAHNVDFYQKLGYVPWDGLNLYKDAKQNG